MKKISNTANGKHLKKLILTTVKFSFIFSAKNNMLKEQNSNVNIGETALQVAITAVYLNIVVCCYAFQNK